MISKMLCGSALALVIGMSPAFAQSDPAPASAPVAADQADTSVDSGTEIIVTANKRAQNLQDVAVAVTPISDDRLKSLNVVSIGELVRIAPSLAFVPAPSPATTMFVVRGVGTFAFNDALEQSVGLVVDGVPLARMAGSVSDAVDMGQVQLLRGPQGTLFGKNATAGVISLDYRQPTFDTTFDGRVFIGSYGEHRVQGTVNAPIVADKVAVRVSGWNFTRNGYINAPYQETGKLGGFHNWGARAKVAITPNDDWRIDLTGEYRKDFQRGALQTTRGYILSPITGLPQNAIESDIRAIDLANGIVAGPDNLTTAKSFPEVYRNKQKRLAAKSEYDLGGVNLTAIAGYLDTRAFTEYDSDYTNTFDPVNATQPAPLLQEAITRYDAHFRQFTSEIRLANSDKGAFKYTAGLFYYNLHVVSEQDGQTQTTALPLTAYDTIANVRTKNYAAFADVSYDIGPVTVFAGGRFSHETTQGTFDRFKSVHYTIPTVVGNGGPLSVSSIPVKTNDFSWRFGAQYHVTDDIMLYASGSRAYKGPGLNYGPSLTAAQFAFNGAVVEKEVAHSWEIGARTQWFDRQLTLNLTGFYSPFTNFQVTTVLPTVPTTFATVNAPEILAKGVELEFSFVPRGDLEGFSLDGSIVYNDTRYKDFQDAPCWTGQPVSATPTTTPGICSPRGGTNVQSVNGFRAVGAPAWTANLTGGYEHDFGAIRGFGQVHYLYNSETQFGVNNNPQSIQKAYSTIDLTLGFGASDKKWTLTGYIRNLTDQRFAGRISVANPTINQTIPFAALRSGGVSLDVSF